MFHRHLARVWLLCGLLTLLIPVLAVEEVDISAEPTATTIDIERPTTAPPATADGKFSIRITSDVPGHLIRPGQAIAFTAQVTNPGAAMDATITARISTLYGTELYKKSVKESLPAKGTATMPFGFPQPPRLPNGAYGVDVWVECGQGIASANTLLSIWNGPAEHPSSLFGISYAGPITTDRTWSDLDLFRQAGIQWLRFPLQGWLPQGEAVPAAAGDYNTFVQEAGKREFKLVAAFTPQTTIDPAVNSVQAEKEYSESLMAAAVRYGFKVKHWELLSVKPDPAFPELKGIGYSVLGKGREALRGADKSLVALYTLDSPFSGNAPELFFYGLPDKNDLLGIRYNFAGLPEYERANPKPPVFDLGAVMSYAKTSIKRTPTVWVTDYGFDGAKGERLPQAGHQAALMARALIFNRINGIERTFWRHDPASQYDLPFTDDQGGVEPSLLAMRTTLELLDQATEIKPLPRPFTLGGLHAYLLRTGAVYTDKEKKKKKKGKSHYVIVAWTESERFATGLSFRSKATHVNVTDLWGNTMELRPTDDCAMFSVNEYPVFVDLGELSDEETTPVELAAPFANFAPPAGIVLRRGGENKVTFHMRNDHYLFKNDLACTVHFRRWPGEDEVKTFNLNLGPYDKVELPWALTVPETATRKGQVYEITADIMLGTRRIGFLKYPVHFSPDPPEKKPE